MRRRHRRRWSRSSSFAAPRRCCRAVIATRIWCRPRSSRHCCAPGRWPRRRPERRRCSLGSTRPRWTPRCALRSSARWRSRTAPPSSSPSRRPDSSASSRLRPFEEVPMLAQQSWALTYSGDHRGGEAAARRALVIAEEAGDAAMTVWALTALLVAVGRQGRYGEALAHARRAAALAADSHDTGSLPLQPKFFLGLALFDCDLVAEARAAYREALDDEFGSGWWLSDTLMADAQACVRDRGVGRRGSRPDRQRPGRAGEGPPAPGVAIARLPGHHRDGNGRSPRRERVAGGDRRLAGGRPARATTRGSWRSRWRG